MARDHNRRKKMALFRGELICVLLQLTGYSLKFTTNTAEIGMPSRV